MLWLPTWSPLIPQGWGGLVGVVYSCMAGMKVLAVYLTFLDAYPLEGLGELGCLVTTWYRWKSLLVWVGPQCFLWCLTGVEHLSKSFLCCQEVSFLFLWLERAGFFWVFICSFAPICISGLQTFSALSLAQIRQKENPGSSQPHGSVCSEVPSQSAFLHLAGSSYAYYICYIQGFQLYLGERVGKSMSVSGNRIPKI